MGWITDDENCYHEMFREPRRSTTAAWLKRPGNTISNVTYFVTSVLVLSASCSKHVVVFSGALFGGMVLVLAVSSTLWHSCHIPFFHYIDLWAMDNTIVYLIANHVLRCWMMSRYVQKTVVFDADRVLAVVYSVIIVVSGYYYLYQLCWKEQYLHHDCGFATRWRLTGNSNVWTEGHRPLSIKEVCVFCGVPLLLGIPLAVFSGSRLAGTLALRTLIVGWSYRILEKWALDGSYTHNSGTFGTVLMNALFSPTAVLHWATGITLLAGYIHARSIQDNGLTKL